MYRKILMVLTGMTLVTGCGGGGGSTPAGTTYSGVTTQAVVTTSNAKALSADAYNGGQVSASASGIAKEAAVSGEPTALLQQTAVLLENSVKTAVGTPGSLAKAVAATAQDTVSGFSGSYNFTIVYDQISGAFNGTVTFTQYKEVATSPSVTGSLSFSGVYNQANGTFTSLNITVSSLYAVKDGRSFSLNGSMVFNISGATKTVGMSVVLTDNSIGRIYWIRDYSMVQTGSSLTMTGTYYDPVHGYVVISTVVPLTVTALDGLPTAGQLLFSGSNGTKARLTFTGSGYTVEVDTAGNGTFVVVP